MRRVHVQGGASHIEHVCRAADGIGLQCLRADPAGRDAVLTTTWATEQRLDELSKLLSMPVSSDFLNLEDLYLEINQ